MISAESESESPLRRARISSLSLAPAGEGGQPALLLRPCEPTNSGHQVIVSRIHDDLLHSHDKLGGAAAPPRPCAQVNQVVRATGRWRSGWCCPRLRLIDHVTTSTRTPPVRKEPSRSGQPAATVSSPRLGASIRRQVLSIARNDTLRFEAIPPISIMSHTAGGASTGARDLCLP